MTDLVSNPEDQFSHVAAHLFVLVFYIHSQQPRSCQAGSYPGTEVIIFFSCSAQLRLKFILLINVKMPTIVGILTFISRINYALVS